jgi:hypothetical protein
MKPGSLSKQILHAGKSNGRGKSEKKMNERHYVTIELINGEFTVKCSQGDLNKKYPTRGKARSVSHLHLGGMDVDSLELALAGKAGHD